MTKPLTTILSEIIDLVADVEQTIAIGAPNPSVRVQIRRPQPGSKPPLDLDAIDLLRTDPLDGMILGVGDAQSHLIDRLGMCCRLVEEERTEAGLSQPQPEYGTWSGVVGYLQATLGWWTCERGVAEDVEHDVRAVHKTLERAARVPQEVILPCPTYGCQGTIHPKVTIREDGSRKLEAETCANGHPVDRHEIARRSVYLADYPLSQIATMVDVPVKTLHDWRSRGRIAPVRRQAGVSLYNLEAILRIRDGLRRTG